MTLPPMARCDVKDRGAIATVVGSIVAQHGKIDVLCNNVGVHGLAIRLVWN